MNTGKKILIVGGGAGGPSTATARLNFKSTRTKIYGR